MTHPSPVSCTHRRTAAFPSSSRGAVLIVAMLVMAALALALGSYLSLNLSSARFARRGYQLNAAFHLAEAGAEEALWSFNQATAHSPAAWTGWTPGNPAVWRRFDGFDLGGNATGSVKVYVDNNRPPAGAQPKIVALASVGVPGDLPVTRMIEVTLNRRSWFSSGLVAKNTVTFAGRRASVDSWNSDPDNNPATPPVPYGADSRNDHGSVATVSVLNAAVTVNQATVWGYVATGGGAPEVGANGWIRGRNTPASVQIDPARVATDFTASFPTVTAPGDGTLLARIGPTLGTAGQATRWRCPSLTLNGGQTLTILGDVTLILMAGSGTSAMDITGNASIIIPRGSSLTVYAEGDIKLAGNGLANGNLRPISCLIWGTNTSPAGQSIQLAGNGALAAAVYAPNAEVKINGNGDVLGSVVARDITLTGNADFHYDESLANHGTDLPFGVIRWRELSSDAARQRYLPLFSGW